MGAMYAGGRGVDRDLIRAYAWFKLAADQGLGDAWFGLGECAELMTDRQISLAERLVLTWKPSKS